MCQHLWAGAWQQLNSEQSTWHLSGHKHILSTHGVLGSIPAVGAMCLKGHSSQVCQHLSVSAKHYFQPSMDIKKTETPPSWTRH